MVASKSFVMRRLWLMQAKVLSTTQRLGRTWNPTWLAILLMTFMVIEVASPTRSVL